MASTLLRPLFLQDSLLHIVREDPDEVSASFNDYETLLSGDFNVSPREFYQSDSKA